MALDSLEKVRFQRQLLIPGFTEASQGRLKAAKILVVGAGGLGSPVLLYLAAAGIGSITICDADQVELSNLNRQVIHSTETLGRKKTGSASQRLRDLYPDVHISERPERMDADNVAQLCHGVDLVLDCLDSFESRRLLNREAVRRRLPLIHAGVQGLSGQVGVFRPADGPCLECLLPPPDVERTNDSASVNSAPLPILGAAAGVLGSIQAMEAVKVITGLGNPLFGRVLFFDGWNAGFDEIMLKKDPDCPICSD
jgi:molybdopterin/thiamine biosynthesis adenylyltransferase